MNNKFTIYKLLFFLLFVLIYIFSINKDPSLGDSIVFTVQAYTGFVFESNATNHLLYTNFLALTHKVLPFINVHFLFVGVSILSALLTLFFLLQLLNLTEVSKRSSFICIMILGFSFTFWRQSIITEVYTFYLLFVVLFLKNLFLFVRTKEIKYFYFLSIFFGLLFLIHIQTILFIPLYGYFLLKNFKILKKHVIYGGLITILLFSILLIPVILNHHPFISIFTDNAYEESIFNFELSTLFKSTVKNIGFVLYNFLFFILFLFWGLKIKNQLDYIIIGILPFIIFCIKHNVSDVYVFHLVPYILILILIGRGLDRFPRTPILLPLLLPFVYFLSFKIIENTSLGEKFNREKGFKGGTRYMFFPPLNENPDLNYFIYKYKEDSLYEIPELKKVYPVVIQWENIKNKN